MDLKNFFKKNTEYIFLVIVLGIFLNLSFGIVLDHKIEHSAPTGFYAQDSFFHGNFMEFVFEKGVNTNSPPYVAYGREDIANRQPGAIYYLVAYVNHFVNFNVHDTQQIFIGFFNVLCVFIIYYFIRRINVKLAILSVPLMVLFFTFPFYAAYTWGLHLFAIGAFLFIAVLYFINIAKTKYDYFLLTVLITSTIFAHTAEFFYAVVLILAYLILLFYLKKLNLKRLVYFLIVIFVSFLLGFHYLVLFFKVFPGGFKLTPGALTYGPATVLYNHLSIFWYIILVGVFLSAYLCVTKNKYSTYFILPFTTFLITLTTWVGFGRAYQLRFYWPIILSIFFAYPIYLFFNWVLPKINAKINSVLFYTLLSLLLIWIVSFGFYNSTASSSIIDEKYWNNLELMDASIEKDSTILFVDPTIGQRNFFWKAKRVSFETVYSDLLEKIQNNDVTDKFETIYLGDPEPIFRESFFTITKNDSIAEPFLQKERSVCEFDYIFLVFRRVNKSYVEYWQNVLSKYLKNGEVFYRDDQFLIVHNKNPGDCGG